MITNRIDNTTNNLQKMVERPIEALHFSPCYKSGGGIDIDRKDTFPQRGETKEYDNTSYQPPLAYNGIKLKADRLYKRLGDGGLILACVITSAIY
jgi:hypothetical protein